MTKIIEVTQSQAVDINRVNSSGVLQGMYDLLDELVNSLDDECAEEIFCTLKERINLIDTTARKNFQFKVSDHD